MNKRDGSKVMVAHPAQQHSYRLATALEKRGILDSYVTTVYCKKGSLTSLVARILPGRFKAKALSRQSDLIPTRKVLQLCEAEGLLKLMCQNIPLVNRWYKQVKYHVADRFAKKVAKLAVARGVDMVITYDDTSPLLFEELKRRAPYIKRVVDMSAANTLYMRHIYERDFELKPDFANKLRSEREVVWNPELANRIEREISSADHFLCPSDFVIRSLEFSGVSRSCCHLVPYGVDIEVFSYKKKQPLEDGPLRFVFVGGTKELKGIAYLLDAFLDIPESDASLTVVGANNLPVDLLERYEKRVVFTGMLLHSEISELLSNMDVMVFPSLGEGFSLAFMEALATGLPVVGSCNSGANDALIEGESGFTIPIQDQEAIRNSVLWFCENREKIPEMSARAREVAERYTWERYYECAARAIEGILADGGR